MSYVAALRRSLLPPSATSIALTLVVTAGAFLAKVCGLGKELAIASQLGAGPQLDAFLYAYMFPVLILTVIAGPVAVAVVPRYLAVQSQVSNEAANRLAGEVASLASFGIVVLVVLAAPTCMIVAPRLAGGFDSPTLSLTLKLIPVMMPLVATSVLSSLWSGLLNARHRFAIAAFVPMISPAVAIFVLLLPPFLPRAMMLAIATVVGAAIEVTTLARVAAQSGLTLFAWPRSWRPEFREVLRQFLPAAGSSLLMSGAILIDQSFAANLTPGSLSALSYGSKLATVAASILVVVVSTLALPIFGRMAAEGAYVRLRNAFLTACVLVAIVTIPLATVLAFGAEPILHLLFVRGSFSAENARLAASVQLLQAWHLPVYVLAILAVRALSAIAETWLLLVGSAANLVVDFTVNALLVPVFGVRAIGFASTAMYSTSALVLCTAFLWQVQRRIKISRSRSP